MNISISESININPLDQSAQPSRFKGLTLLVVDDEPDSLDILTLVLEEEGAEVISVVSAQAALSVFSKITPDLIVSDIGMPHTDGYTLIEEVRKLPQGQNIPAIALTAYAGEIDMQQSLDAGFQKHLAKPINIPQLIRAITELL
ncbi:MAG: response regulator [Pleurocapsa sp. MO_192.B19]|nr:response regulator [Pleurocapsa sp. MO_192.B19]